MVIMAYSSQGSNLLPVLTQKFSLGDPELCPLHQIILLLLLNAADSIRRITHTLYRFTKTVAFNIELLITKKILGI